ncbi:transporter [Desulfovibrio sp. OttesenSCG-928-C06]|nr:transporter [Desulfovibrio sp. OttesenSCG-928-C06]
MLYLDLVVLGNGVYEQSLTEVAQALILLAMVACYLRLAARKPEYRSTYVLIAGFFACMLVREMDFYLDELWFPLALAVTLVCCWQAWRRREQALGGLVYFCRSRSFGVVLSGIVTLLVFSRLLGMKILWQALLGDQYVKVLKNAIEEGTEQFGYLLCLIGTVWHAFIARRDRGRHVIAAQNFQA